jgi:altronate dehydratase
MYQLLHRTYRGYATHPNVAAALLLEHGCEKIPNDVMRRLFETANLPLERFGWASVQLDGGIEKALANVEAWFVQAGRSRAVAGRMPVGLGTLTVGLLAAAPVGQGGAEVLARVARTILDQGGSVLVPEGDPLLGIMEFRRTLLGAMSPRATLAYGQPFTVRGLHLVQTDSDHWVENLAGLGACGVHVFLGLVGETSQQGHPMLPVLQVAEAGILPASMARDVDVILEGSVVADEAALLHRLADTVQGISTPAATVGGFTDFQLSRGLLGVST